MGGSFTRRFSRANSNGLTSSEGNRQAWDQRQRRAVRSGGSGTHVCPERDLATHGFWAGSAETTRPRPRDRCPQAPSRGVSWLTAVTRTLPGLAGPQPPSRAVQARPGRCPCLLLGRAQASSPLSRRPGSCVLPFLSLS